MASNADSTNDSNLPSFSAVKTYERRAIILRSEGKTFEVIAANIAAEFAMEYSDRTIRDWFAPGGRLEQAHSEYNEAMAEQSLKQGRQLIKKATQAAAANMISKLASHDERVSLDASKSLLNKYIPDKQINLTGEHAEEELPEEIAKLADSLGEADDGSQPVDDAPVDGADSQIPGA